MENEPSNPQQMFDVKYIFSRVRHGHYDDILNALQRFSVDTKDNQGILFCCASQNGYRRIANYAALWR